MKEKWYTQWESFGKRIQLAREKADITREQLAHAIGLSKENLRRIECGQQSTTLETLYKISCVLNISIDSLLLGTQQLSNDNDATDQLVQTDKEQIDKLLQNLSPMQLHFAYKFLNASIQFFNSFQQSEEE